MTPAQKAALGRALLWWVVIGIWAYVLALAVPAYAAFAQIGQHDSSTTYPGLACTPGAPLEFRYLYGGGVVDEGTCPAGGAYTCANTFNPATGQPYGWSGYGTCWEDAAAVQAPEPPASSASGALGCGGSVCLKEETFEAWARIALGLAGFFGFAVGITHGRWVSL